MSQPAWNGRTWNGREWVWLTCGSPSAAAVLRVRAMLDAGAKPEPRRTLVGRVVRWARAYEIATVEHLRESWWPTYADITHAVEVRRPERGFTWKTGLVSQLRLDAVFVRNGTTCRAAESRALAGTR